MTIVAPDVEPTPASGRAPRERDPLYMATIALGSSTLITAVLGLAFWAVAARLYDTAEVGIASAAVSAMTLLASVSQCNVAAAVVRYLPEAGRDSRRLLTGAYGITVVAGAVVGVGFATLASGTGMGSFLAGPGWFPPLFVGAVVVGTIFVVQDSALVALRAAGVVPVENGVFALVKLVLLVALARTKLFGAVFVAWAIAMAGAVAAVSGLVFRRLLPTQANDGNTIDGGFRRVASFTAGTYVGNVVQIGTNALVPLIVTAERGVRQTALFYPAWVVVMTLEALLASLGTAITAEGARDTRQVGKLVWQARRIALIVLLPGLAVIGLGAPTLLSVFGHQYSVHAATVLRLFVVGAGIRIAVAVGLAVARIREQVGPIVVTNTVSSIALVGVAWALIPRFGLPAAGLAYVVEQVVAIGCIAPALRRETALPGSAT